MEENKNINEVKKNENIELNKNFYSQEDRIAPPTAKDGLTKE